MFQWGNYFFNYCIYFKWEISERETEHERLLTLGNKLGVVEGEVGRGGGDWVTGTEVGT